MPNVEEILSTITTQDPAKMGAETMAQMIQEGNAAGLAEMMLSQGRIFPAIIDILTHEKWPLRLGAMVVAETLADKSKAIGGELTEPLWKKFHVSDDSVQGDILWILGIVGDRRILPRLSSVMNGPFSAEVKAAAMEAAETAGKRSAGPGNQ